MKNNDKINAIIIKALSDEELSADESESLNAWLKDGENQKLLENLKTEEYIREKFIIGNHGIDEQEFGLLLWERVNRPPSRIIPLGSSGLRYIAAAVVLLTVITAFWLYNKKPVSKPEQKNQFANVSHDVLPGKFKAMLTLADGRRIALDSAAKGTLAEQGNTSIINKDGKLVYSGRENGAATVLYNTVATAKGQMYPVVLADNSRVWLNSASSIRFPVAFIGNERRIEITGEAFFEVAHDATKPFVVSVNGKEIRVLGTKFNVSAYLEDGPIKTTLVEGSIRIKSGSALALLKPGQQAVINDNAIQTNNDADIYKITAWKDNRFYFKDDDIQTVMKQIVRWYDVEVNFKSLPDARFNAKISRNVNASIVFEALQATGEIHFQIEGRKIMVSK